MIKFEKYDGTKTYQSPAGTIWSPQKIRETFPAVDHFTHIVETDDGGEVLFGILNLSGERSKNNIDFSLSEDEAIKAIEDIRNAPPPDPVMSPEEMLAAAIQEYTAVAEARLLMDM